MKDDNEFKWFPTKWKVIFAVFGIALAIYMYIISIC